MTRTAGSLRFNVNVGLGIAVAVLALTTTVYILGVWAAAKAADRRRDLLTARIEVARLQASLGPTGNAPPAPLRNAYLDSVLAGDSAAFRHWRAAAAAPDSINLHQLGTAVMAAADSYDGRAHTARRLAATTGAVAGTLAIAFLVVAAILINRDMTQRAHAEAALGESESRLKQILEAVPVGVFVVDGQGHSYYANQESRRILGAGISPDTPIDRLPEVYHAYRAGTGELLAAADQPIVHALAGRESSSRDIEIRQPGRTIPIEVFAAPVLDADGTVAFAIAAFSDVSEPRRAEAAFRDLSAELEDLYQNAPCGYHSLDAAGVINRMNDTELLWLGYTRDEIVGRFKFSDLLGDESRLTLAQHLSRARTSGVISNLDLMMVRKNGTTFPVLVSMVPLLDDEGRLIRHRCSVLDVTDRRSAELAVSEARDTAEAANRAKTDFLARMSHELRTPLNSIIGFSEVLADGTFGTLNEKQRRYVTNVHSSGRQLLELINDILDLSKIEAGRMDLLLAPLSIGAAIADVHGTVTPMAERKRLTVSTALESDLPPLVADLQRFKQMLSNLLSNAIKYTPDGGSIGITARRIASEVAPGAEDWVEIAVTDTGIGIRPEDQDRIFGEFEQVASGYVRGQQGTGLGLPLTRRLAELHGGRVWVESAPGEGSTFRLLLPLRGRPDAILAPRADEAIRELWLAGEGPRVLVIDDEPTAADLVGHYLSEAGYRVTIATTGEAALNLARQLQPDAITLDILLPDRDGLNVLARLKSDPVTRRIPVIVVSVTEDKTVGYSLGATDWFVKPVAREDLLRAVRQALPAAAAGTALVIDDDPSALELLTDYLAQARYKVLTAADGKDGLARALEEHPDIIVLDLLMPNMNGFDVVDALRNDPAGRNIPILICTAKELTERDRARLRGTVQGIVGKGDVRGRLLGELRRATMKSA